MASLRVVLYGEAILESYFKHGVIPKVRNPVSAVSYRRTSSSPRPRGRNLIADTRGL